MLPGSRLERPPMTGIVLAGGRSRRMGRDKALLEWDGEPLVERVARLLAECCVEVLVASGDGDRLGRPDEIGDALPDSGPLGGVVAGLERAAHSLVAVVAVDMPHASPEVLRVLARALRDAPAVVPVVDGRTQPLHAIYRKEAAPRLRKLLESGERSVVRAVELLGGREAGPEVWGATDPEGRFARNVNRPEDLG